MCSGIGGLEVAKECVSPASPPWLPFDQCFHIYQFREFRTNLENQDKFVEIRVKYDHALCFIGRKQGPLVFTFTLLPLEELTLYHYERYRRTSSATARFSERTSFFEFTQKVAGQSHGETRREVDEKNSTSGSVSGGGGGVSLGFISFGGGGASMSGNSARHFTDVTRVGGDFEQTAKISSQAVESERSIVVSFFEEKDSVDVTSRKLRNENHCRAVTYFVRRVFEVYTLTTTIVAIEARVRGGDWLPIEALPDEVAKDVKRAVEKLEKVGTRFDSKTEIFLPTDGLLYEPELAHCCSCEPGLELELHLKNEKLKVEVGLLEQEIERRKALIAAGELGSFDAVAVPAGP
jgi:thermitase